jgi:hypothetical protein
VPADVKKLHLPAISRLPASQRLDLVIVLPFRNESVLDALLRELYDPFSPRYHHFLTADKFAKRFAPSALDYQTITAFARSNGLTVTRSVGDHSLVDVAGSVADIEKAFHVTLLTYEHPTEARVFFAPDVEPSVDLKAAILRISGLDNYVSPRQSPLHVRPITSLQTPVGNLGSGASGTFLGSDFRNAYALTSLTGKGQVVGLVELNGYTPSDITTYENLIAPPPSVNVVNALVNITSPLPESPGPDGHGYPEAPMDIELVIAMAPGLDQVTVYEGNQQDDILEEIAAPTLGEPLPFQVSTSWFLAPTNSTAHWIQRLKSQGQSLFQAAGDQGPDAGNTTNTLIDQPWVTVVGGTELSMNGVGASWESEVVWQDQNGSTGGGYTCATPIPSYQIGINMSAIMGSEQCRNFPDVAMVAENIEIVHTDPSIPRSGIIAGGGGTSASAPLWAAFTALVNQQAAANGHGQVGFINPLIYSIAAGPDYQSDFHDIVMGTCMFPNNPTEFTAAPGFDLCSGWGSPHGQALIDAMAPAKANPCTYINKILSCTFTPIVGWCPGGSGNCLAVCDRPCGGARVTWTPEGFLGSDPWLFGTSISFLTDTIEQGHALSEQWQVTVSNPIASFLFNSTSRGPTPRMATEVMNVGASMTIEFRPQRTTPERNRPRLGQLSLPYDAALVTSRQTPRIVRFDKPRRRWMPVESQSVDRARHVVTARVSGEGRFAVIAEALPDMP